MGSSEQQLQESLAQARSSRLPSVANRHHHAFMLKVRGAAKPTHLARQLSSRHASPTPPKMHMRPCIGGFAIAYAVLACSVLAVQYLLTKAGQCVTRYGSHPRTSCGTTEAGHAAHGGRPGGRPRG